jgi:uncharacterized membrane protein
MGFENIHPAIVHFPIALLGFYAILEIARFPWLKNQPWYFYVKAVLVIAGSVAVLAAIIAGSIMANQFKATPLYEIIKVHATSAIVTAVIFIGLGKVYLIAWCNRAGKRFLPEGLWRVSSSLSNFTLNGPLVVIAALVGLLVLLNTASLGASMVWGPENDPLVRFIYHLYFD